MITIGSTEGEHVLLTQFSRFDDAGFCIASAEVQVTGFVGKTDPYLAIRDLAVLREGIIALHENLSGVAKFSPIEDELTFELKGDGKGHVLVKGQITNYAGGANNQLLFEFEIDQTFLPSIAKSIEEVLHSNA